MANTANYNLYLSDDDNMSFLEWRNKINGLTDSNTQKIDAALGEKADSSVSIPSTLLMSGWAGETAPYTQQIEVLGLTGEQNGTISVSHSATPEQRDSARFAMLSVIGQSDGILTIVADGEMPEVDIPVFVVLIG